MRLLFARPLLGVAGALALLLAGAALGQDDGSGGQGVQNIPGMDFSSLSPSAQKELANVFSDEFCYCGCPHSLGACLRTHRACKHARRMATLAAAQAANGVPATEIINSLSAYYLSFRDPRQSFTPDERMCQGSKTAPVTLVEFADFECPYCGQARPVVEKFAKGNPKVRLCSLPFPLPMHPNAIPAGEIALLARDHNKYWAVHDALFENQTHLSVEEIKKIAEKAGLPRVEVDRALGPTSKYRTELDGFSRLGRTAGVDATPTFYFNGHKLVLPFSAEALGAATDDEQEWAAHQGAWAAD